MTENQRHTLWMDAMNAGHHACNADISMSSVSSSISLDLDTFSLSPALQAAENALESLETATNLTLKLIEDLKAITP